MHLPQIRGTGIFRDARAMLDRDARVRVALDAQPGQQPDEGLGKLRKTVQVAGMHRADMRHAIGAWAQAAVSSVAARRLAKASACCASRASTITRSTG